MNTQQRTILLVDDEAIIAMGEAEDLQREGYAVITVNTGEEAIEAVERAPGGIDLILMDIDLGRGMDGTEAAREILKIRDIPVVFLSSHTEKTIVEKTEKITSYGYVVKNTGITVLAASIRMAFRLHDAHDRIQMKNMEIEAASEEMQAANEELEAANTELIRSQRDLMESEDRYRCLFEQGSDALFVADPVSHRLVDCNRKAEDLTGYSREEILSMSADRLHAEDVREAGMEHFREFASGRRSCAVESVVITREGARVPVSVNAGIVDTGGKTVLIGIFRDMTERTRAEEAMRASERQMKEIVDGSPVLQFVIDRNHHILYWNRSLERYSGIPAGDVIGTNQQWRAFYGSERPCMADLILEGQIEEIDRLYKGKGSRSALVEDAFEGTDFFPALHGGTWLYFTAAPIRDENGVVIGALETLADVTERKRAEEALRDSERRMNDILNNVGAYIFIKDTKYRYTYANRKVCELFGGEERDILGRGDDAFFSAESFEEIMRSDSRVIEHGETVTREETDLVSSDGMPRTYWAVKIPLMDSSGAITGLCGISTDITKKKQTEFQAQAYIGFLEKLEIIDRVMREADDLNKMLENLLDTVRAIFDSDRAWLLEPCDPGAPSFRVRMMRTRPEYPADIAMSTDLPVAPDVATAMRELLASTGPVIFDSRPGNINPLSGEFSIKSQMVLAIRPKSGPPWAFGMHQCSYERTWSIEDQRLFREVGRRISDGLSSMLFMETLRGSEEKYRVLVENLNVGIFMTGMDGKILHANPAIARICGFGSGEEMRAAPAQSVYDDPEDRQRVIGAMARDGFVSDMELRFVKRDGTRIWISMSAVLMKGSGGNPDFLLGTVSDITERKRMEEALDRRLVALTRPLGDVQEVSFDELFNIDDIQHIQDLFAAATGVASIITNVDGTPITRPSSFCRLCNEIIRTTGKGLANCYHSDAVIGRHHPEGPVIQPCLSGGLWDAGASIAVGGHHIANWLIGQVRDETQSEEMMRRYAQEIGADEEELVAAFNEVPTMSRERFDDVARALFVLASQLSLMAYQNVQQARIITERREAVDALTRSVAEKEILLQEIRHRVKNSLNIASNLISLKMHDVSDEKTRTVFTDVISRIESISAVYEQLHAEGGLDRIDLARYILRLTELLKKSYAPREDAVSIMTVLAKVSCDLKRVVPLGLILNELVTNALKYAYPPGARGEIRVALETRGDSISLAVSDDGPGLPPGGVSPHGGGLGIRLVGMLCRQIDGTLVFEDGPGTRVRVTFPA
jgi:PAS domain S-box-containing protein